LTAHLRHFSIAAEVQWPLSNMSKNMYFENILLFCAIYFATATVYNDQINAEFAN